MTKGNSKSNTLVFVTSTSTKMPWIAWPERDVNPMVHMAHSGIYSCTVGDGDCENVQNVALSKNGDYKFLDGFFVMNLAIYVSSKNKQESSNPSSTNQIEEVKDDTNMDDGNNYMYAGAIYNHEHDYGRELYSWEIQRASLNNDGEIQFHPYFKTMEEFDWNQCGFDCCPFNDEPDSNGYQTHRDRHDYAFMHAYVRGRPRAHAVDEKTGDIFISWEGFYKNCDPANHFKATSMLEWTIGVSRLKTHAEDPDCVAVIDENGEYQNFHQMSNNFGKCTVPVSIVAMETHGRNIQLPYGGLTIIPAAEEEPAPGVKPRRTFLMSVFDPGVGETHLWAVPEDADVTESRYKRQELHSSHLGLHVLKLSSSIWSGGNIRVHINQKTGRPDHVCRTVFDKGIRCLPITLTEDKDSTYVTVTGDEEIYLTEEQVHSFCVYPEMTARLKGDFGYKEKSTVVTGLDVEWNEEDGTPQRVYFGCYGLQSAGRLGSVEKDGENLKEVMPGAYSGDVIFLPRELEVSTVRIPLEGEVSSSSLFGLNRASAGVVYGLAIAGALLVVGIALHGFYKKRYPSPSRRAYSTDNSTNSGSSRAGLPAVKYMELPVMSASSNHTADLSPSSSSSELA